MPFVNSDNYQRIGIILMFLICFFLLLILSFSGCAQEQFIEDPDAYEIDWQPDQVTYDEWLEILGSDEAVEDYILDVQDCSDNCLDEGATGMFVLKPPSEEACSCIFQWDP